MFRAGAVPTLLVLLAILPPGVAAARPAAPPDTVRLANLEAFARLYGVVRFFHPSDEAAATDWHRFAVLGAERVAAARSLAERAELLRELFRPIAPSVGIHRPGESPPGASRTADTSGPQVAWQHFGVGLTPFTYYSSTRTARPGIRGGRDAVRVIQPAPLPGPEIRWVRLRAMARATTEPGGEAQLLVAFPAATGMLLHHHPIHSAGWTAVESVAPVAPGSPVAILGVTISGSGELWWDDVEAHASADSVEWQPLPLTNAGFDATASHPPTGWSAFVMDTTGVQFTTDTLAPFRGRGSGHLRVQQADRLFDAAPVPGSVRVVELGDGLTATVPLVLPSVGGTTRPAADPTGLAGLQEAMAAAWLRDSTISSAMVRVAGVVEAWTILHHFFPYHDDTRADWQAVLRPALEAALHAATPEQYQRVLNRMLVPLQDGHARVVVPGAPVQGRLPARFVRAGHDVIVATSATEALQAGDLVQVIDDVTARELLERGIADRSGSPHYREHLALARLGEGPVGSAALLRIERDGEVRAVSVMRTAAVPPRAHRPEPITAFEGGIVYVDLTRVGGQELLSRVDRLADADGLVFDVRGYPQDGAHLILAHLTNEPMRFYRGYVAQVIHPDRTPPPAWADIGTTVQAPRTPRFRGSVVFLTDAGAMSYGETVMGLVTHYRLGAVVGEPTGGVNGDQNRVALAGGVHLFWTGTRVVRHDGGRHFAVGYPPTILVEPTRAGLASGTDEQLEVALELLRTGSG